MGSVQQYLNELADPDRYRPDHCPPCEAASPLTAQFLQPHLGGCRVRRLDSRAPLSVPLLSAHGIAAAGVCPALPPLQHHGDRAILITRLVGGSTLGAAAVAAMLPGMPYQRGQLWVCRFRSQTERLCAVLAALIAPPSAPDFVSRALLMLQSIGWIAAA